MILLCSPPYLWKVCYDGFLANALAKIFMYFADSHLGILSHFHGWGLAQR